MSDDIITRARAVLGRATPGKWTFVHPKTLEDMERALASKERSSWTPKPPPELVPIYGWAAHRAVRYSATQTTGTITSSPPAL